MCKLGVQIGRVGVGCMGVKCMGPYGCMGVWGVGLQECGSVGVWEWVCKLSLGDVL